MKVLVILGFAVMMAAPCVGMMMNGSYVFVNTGLARHGDMFIPVRLPAEPDVDFQVRTETGSDLAVTAGCGLNVLEYLRLEAEIGYRPASINKIVVLSGDIPGLGMRLDHGDIDSLSLMGSLWYDMDMESSWRPYFGGGIGLARVSLADFTIETFPLASESPTTRWLVADGSDWQPAYQFGVGMGYDLSSRMSVRMGYRYFFTADPEITDVHGTRLKIDNTSHTFEAGLRFSF